MGRVLLCLACATALLAGAASDYLSAKRKFDLIQKNRIGSGEVVLKLPELNAYIQREVKQVAPDGVREPRLELGHGRASGFAYVDFARLKQARGEEMNWFMERMLSGEKPVKVDARISSGNGAATVDVERVEVGGMAIKGAALDFLIRNFLESYYPEAKIGKPFELEHGIERLDLKPSEVRVVIKH